LLVYVIKITIIVLHKFHCHEAIRKLGIYHSILCGLV